MIHDYSTVSKIDDFIFHLIITPLVFEVVDRSRKNGGLALEYK